MMKNRLLPALSLKTRISVALVTLLGVAAVLLTLASITVVQDSSENIITEEQSALIKKTAVDLDQDFKMRQVALQNLGQDVPKDAQGDPQVLQRFLEQHRSLLVLFDNFAIFDLQGAQLANLLYPEKRAVFNASARKYFIDTVNLKKGLISDPRLSAISGKLIVLVTVPLLDARGGVEQVMVGTIMLDQGSFLRDLTSTRVGKTGYYFVMTDDGVMVAHPDTRLILQNVSTLGAKTQAFNKALGGFEGTLRAADHKGVPGLVSFKRLASTNWIIGSFYPEAEAFAIAREIQWKSALVAAALILLGAPLAWLFALWQVMPLQHLRARIFSARENPAQSIQPGSYAKDEIGALAQEFDNMMRERLFAEAKYQASAEELRAATESSLDGFFIFKAERDADGKIVGFYFDYMNANAERLVGMSKAEAKGKRLDEWLPGYHSSGFFDKHVRVVETGQTLQEEFQLSLRGVEAIWLSHQAVPLADGIAVTTRDISERKRSELELHKNRNFLNLLIDYLPVGIYTKSIGEETYGRIILWNKGAELITGLTAAQVIGKTDREIHPERAADAYEEHDRTLLADPMPMHFPAQPFRRPDGKMRVIDIKSFPIFDDHGNVEYILGILEDITARKKSEDALVEEKERLRVTLNSIGDAVITTDTEGRVTYLNPVAEEITGWPAEEAIGQSLPNIFHIIDEKTGKKASNQVLPILRGENAMAHARSSVLIQRGGVHFVIDESAAPIRDAGGGIIGAILVFHDVSEAHLMAAEMSHQATHDALTGLINRGEFENRLINALRGGDFPAVEHTLLYLDLDQFKIVNDTSGHVTGDELLRQLTPLLLANLRQSDTLGRLGGDEFGVLLENCATEPAMRVAELLRQTVADFHFTWLDINFPVSVSIGLATFSNTGETLADVLRMADAACYVAKDKGRNRIHVYTPEDKELAQRHGEMAWIGKIQKALDENRFVLYSQKILPLEAGLEQGEHYEILMRMLDEEGKLVPPMAFIPAAERYGLMPILDRWVIRTAFSQYAARHPAGTPAGTCSINLSGTSICDETLLKFVVEQFARFKVPPQAICFEVTETAAIANLSQAAALMREFRAIGCRISLDDFGSGMSSFAYLKHLPVDYLKIDGAFVKDMMGDPIDHAMVKAINQIGHVMGLKTIAEFVENDAILEELRRIGVDFAQGYGIEKPRPAVQAKPTLQKVKG
ncbi:hypothetical protein BH11PSE11_BH11PSE11_30360 [soil metagenome]